MPSLALKKLANAHLHLARVGNLDADGVLPGNRSQNIDPFRTCGTGKVFFQRRDTLHTHAGGGIDLVTCDCRTLSDVSGRSLNVELGKRLQNDLLHSLKLGRISGLVTLIIVGLQKIKARQGIFLQTQLAKGAGSRKRITLLRVGLAFHHFGQCRLASRRWNTGIDDLG